MTADLVAIIHITETMALTAQEQAGDDPALVIAASGYAVQLSRRAFAIAHAAGVEGAHA
jgi:hypothetical protein